ncbi:MAG: hypothetical protein R2684_13100 [Pyrinomonadaceae bacterium]
MTEKLRKSSAVRFDSKNKREIGEPETDLAKNPPEGVGDDGEYTESVETEYDFERDHITDLNTFMTVRYFWVDWKSAFHEVF